MAIRQPPTSVKDPNLRAFLQELRNAIGKTGEQVNKLISVRTIPGGGGGGGGDTPGDGGGGGGGPTTPPTNPPSPPKTTTVVLSVSPARPTINNPFTLTATVSGDNPTGTVIFRQDGALMTLDPIALSASVASTTTTITQKGAYTFIAEYSGDTRNLAAVSNSLTVDLVSNWDGRPPPPTSLSARGDMWAVYLDWTNPYIGDYSYTEVWASNTLATFDATAYDNIDPPSGVTKVGQVTGGSFTFQEWNGVLVEAGETYYFWLRNVDDEGLKSTWYPVGAGAEATVANDPGRYLDILTGSITETQLFKTLGGRIEFLVPLETAVTGLETDVLVLQDGQDQLAQQLSQISAGSTGFDSGKIWYFNPNDSISDWSAVADATIALATTGTLDMTPTGSAPNIKVSDVDVRGAEYTIVKARINRGANTGDWKGELYYYTQIGNSGTLVIDEPTYDADGWASIEWDLNNDSQWCGCVIDYLELRLLDGTASPWGGVLKIDWFAVGRYAPGASVAQVVNLERAQVGYCAIPDGNGNPGTLLPYETKTLCEANEGTWFGGLPLAAAVQQVSVGTGGFCTIGGKVDSSKTSESACISAGGTWTPSTVGGIEQRFTAMQNQDDSFRLQYTVKIDNNGYVAGFGLASEPVDGVPYSDFMVRADRFSIAAPTVPGALKTISGNLTHSGGVATVTATAHGFLVDDVVSISNVQDYYWNRSFKITAKTDNTFSFAVSNNPLCLSTSAAASTAAISGRTAYAQKVKIPFIVTTTTDAAGTPPGVYIDDGYIRNAAITNAKIADATILNAKIGNYLASSNWPTDVNGIPNGSPNNFPFAGWRLSKDSGAGEGAVEIYGGFALYDSANGDPIITAGRINVSKLRRLILTASPADVFTLAKNTGTASPSTISLIATLQNIVPSGSTATVTWYLTAGSYRNVANTGYVTGTPSGTLYRTDTGISADTTLTIDPAKFNSGVNVVGFKAVCTYGGTTYEDTFSVAKLAEGTDSTVMYLSNEFDSVTAAADGSISASFIQVTSNVKVYRGATNVLYGASSETSPAWAISYTVTANGTTSASYTTTQTLSGTTYAYNAGTGDFTVDMRTASFDQVKVNITATRGSESLTKVLTVSKQKPGAAGSSGVVIDLDNESHTVPTDANGNNGNFTGCATTASLYLGASDISGAVGVSWSAPSVVTGSVTGAASNGDRTYTVTAMSSDAATIRLRATYSGVNYDTIFTVTKAKGGATGTPATTYSIVPDVASIKRTAIGVTPIVTVPATTLTVTGYTQTGNAAPVAWGDSTRGYVRFFTSTDGVNFTASTSGQLAATTGKIGWTISGAVTHVRAALYADSGYATLLDQETIPIVADGAAGVNAKSLRLTADSQIFTINKAGANSPGQVNLTALLGGSLSGTVVWSTTPSVTLVPASNTLQSLPFANMGANNSVTVTASLDGLSDSITIVKVNEGADTVNAFLTNGVHTFTCDLAGNVTSYLGSDTYLQVYEGANLQVYSGTVVSTAEYPPESTGKGKYNVKLTNGNIGTRTPSGAGSNLYLPPATTGVAAGTDASSTVLDIYLRTTSNKLVALQQIQTFSKSKQGATGPAGSDGKVLTLSADSQIFTISKTGTNTPAQIVLTAYKSAAVTETLQWVSDPVNVVSGTGNTKTLTFAGMGANNSVKVTVSAPNAGLSDSITISKVTEGSDAFTSYLSNSQHTLTCDSAGNVTDGYLGSDSLLYVFEGANKQTFSGTVSATYPATKGTYNVTLAYYNTAARTATVSGSDMLLGPASGVFNGVDVAVTTVTVYLFSTNGKQVTFQQTQTLSKSKQGTAGPGGNRGSVFDTISDTSWNNTPTESPTRAWNAIVARAGTVPVAGDYIYLNNETTPVYAYNGGAFPGNWVSVSQKFHGAVLFPDSITANRIKAGTITADRIQVGGIDVTRLAAGAATASGGYSGSVQTAINPGTWGPAPFWAPTRPSANYTRGNISFVANLIIQATGLPVGTTTQITYQIKVERDLNDGLGYSIPRLFSGVSTTVNKDQTFNATVVFLDALGSNNALAYRFSFYNGSAYTVTVNSIDEYWVEYKR